MAVAAFQSVIPDFARNIAKGVDSRQDTAATARPVATLIADIDRLAAMWRGAEAPADQPHWSGDAAFPTPEALADAAMQRGLDVRFEQIPLRKLGAEHWPCIVLERSGETRIVLKRTQGGFDTLFGGAPEVVDAGELGRRYAGTVFLVRPQPAQAQPAVAGAGDPPRTTAALAATGNLFIDVAGRMVRGQTRLFVQLCLAAVVNNSLVLALPIFSMVVYDRVVPHLAFETLWAMTIGVGIALAADTAVRFVRTELADAMAIRATVGLQTQLFGKLLRAPLSRAPRDPASLGLWMRELESLCQTVPAIAVAMLVDLPFILLVSLLLASLGGVVAFVPIVCALVLAILFAVGHAMATDANRDATRLARAQTALFTEAASALESVKATTAEAQLMRRWEELADANAYAGHRARHWTHMTGLAANAMGMVAIVATLVVGVYVNAAGAMTVGALTAASLLIGRIMSPVATFVGAIFRTRQILRAAEGLDAVLRLPAEEAGDGAAATRDIVGKIELRNVSLTYLDGAAPALRGVSLVIAPGEKVAIIGRVGCGKSSLLRLILRLQEPTEGAVLLDDADIRQVSPVALRRSVALMRQDHVLLDDTLDANLRLGLEGIAQEALDTAVQVSGVRELAARNPNGYSQKVGPRGDRLSGGERQMVALARALAADPRVLVLDEPTAAMDNSMEARIVRDLARFVEGRTLILATHRAQALALVDRIIWLDGGAILADGPKDEVLKTLNSA